MEKERKVVQIAFHNGGICALCNDGSMWIRGNESAKWYEIEGIPSFEEAITEEGDESKD